MAFSILPVLMAGGSGTRLWPLSREDYPKQFLRLIDDKSLLQNTALRAAKVNGALPPLVICGEGHRFAVAEQLDAIGMQKSTILLEPEGRNTAPAAACAALYAAGEHGPDTLVFLMSADQSVNDVPAFVAAAQAAAKTARGGPLTVFGVKPTRAETGFGYIKSGPPLKSGGGREVAAFVEKPDAKRAAKFLKDGGYWWNGGLFMFQAGAFLDELKKLEPAMLEACAKALKKGERDGQFLRLDAPAFRKARNDSIDYAVMEKTRNVAMVPLDCGWDDVGSWAYLSTLKCDERGNVVRGDVLLDNAENCLVQSDSRLVAVVGIKDAVVVETSDAVLVTTRGRAQDVKKIVQTLKERKRYEARHRPRVYRPWGWYETISLSDRYQVKRIYVKPGQKLSLQMHHHRAEHWTVVKGTAQVTCDDKVFLLGEDQSTYIPLGSKHRLENLGKMPLELIEVQSGAYLGEDDIVRFEDIYGRAPAAETGKRTEKQ
jgi:mannose-1-phosphate guanylyltransferase/mannose-6-phosphate isomerase